MRRALIFLHRWIGVTLCGLFLLWFLSGIAMMYTDFPSVRPEDRLARSPALDPEQVRLSAAEAAATLGPPGKIGQIRLTPFNGRAAYRFRSGRGERIVYADTGEESLRPEAAMIARAAADWTGLPAAAAKVESVEAVDQWTVQGALRNLRPLWKFSWPDGQQVYVSGLSGEVVQYTTRASRLQAYLGPIPHWLYFTALRQRQAAWSRTVIWTSGVGTVGALLGIVVGVAGKIPYRGPKRWHTILGLIFGVGAMTWAFSGMLSMDPFPTREEPADLVLRDRVTPATFVKHPRDVLREIGSPVKELELISIGGEAVYLAPQSDVGIERVIAAIQRTTKPSEVRVLNSYDAYYLDRHHRKPLPVVLAVVNDTRYYIDPRTARVVGSYNSRSWVSRWLYHGLHSLDFPWLYAYRPLWDIVVISFMLGGAALSITSIVLAWRVLTGKRRAVGY